MLGSFAQPNAGCSEAVADGGFSRVVSRYYMLCDFFSLGIHRIRPIRPVQM